MAYIHGEGGGNYLIISDKEVSKNYSSPRAVSTNDTARGLFAFRRFRVARMLCRQENRTSELFRSYVARKTMLLKCSEPLSLEKLRF